MSRLPVFAAVPNYNMGEQLKGRLPQLVEGGYNEIFVLDDHSHDGSDEAVRAVSTDIHFVRGETNVGAGANRNRILDALSREAIIHFIDADTVPETERMAEVVADCMPTFELGFIGGLVLTPEGTKISGIMGRVSQLGVTQVH